MKLPLVQIDAFTSRPFGGNPAAVCRLDAWLDDETMQNIATENNLSETAFYVDAGEHYDLRWFTPAAEVDLCGHATLATAHELFHQHPGRDEVAFETRSGRLTVQREGELLLMDLPAESAQECEAPEALSWGLEIPAERVLRTPTNYLVEFASESTVAVIRPDFGKLAELGLVGVIVTAPGETDEIDFVSRYFAPRFGIDEDPVTGSAHCALAPFWSERLGKQRTRARQISPRVGDLVCEVRGKRVIVAGNAVTVMRGELEF